MNSIAVRCENLSKRYAGARAVNDVSLNVAAGEILALVGPSGCGKTTTLRLIAGLEKPDAGWGELGGRFVAGPRLRVPAGRRGRGMVVQDYAILPHLNVLQNVIYGSKGQRPSQMRENAIMMR